MDFVRVHLGKCRNEFIFPKVIYTDGKDEYKMYLECPIENDVVKVRNYRIEKGNEIGF